MKISKRKKRVAVIFGGTGPEHDVSVRSAENFISALSDTEFSPLPIYVSKSGTFKMFSPRVSVFKMASGEAVGINTYPVRVGCKRGFLYPFGVLPVFAAIPLLHGEGGEDGTVAGALACAGIDYSGADTVSCALCYNKAYTKAIAETVGIPTVPWVYINKAVRAGEEDSVIAEVEGSLDYPVFVKPATLGSSIGCSAVYGRDELIPAIRAAAALSAGKVIVEKMIEAPIELEVAYYEDKCKEIYTNPGEITYKDGFYSFEEKYSPSSSARVLPVSESGDFAELVKGYSRSLVSAIGITHMCRIDFFVSAGVVYFNEINTIPGMTQSSLYPRMLAECGISPKNMAEGLVLSAVHRNDWRL